MTTQCSLFDDAINEQVLELKFETMFKILDDLPLPVWICTPDAGSLWSNKQWSHYSGATPQDMHEWCWQDFYHPDDLPRVAGSFCACLKTETPWQDFFLLRRYDGVYNYHSGRSVPVREQSGSLLYWLVYFMALENKPFTKALDIELI